MRQFEITTGGHVAFIHKLSENHVITITNNGIIKLWHISIHWNVITNISLKQPSFVTFSCLSYNKTYLAVLKNAQHLCTLYVYLFCKMPQLQFSRMPYFMHTFDQKTICCDISQNDQYIAIGLETGKISVSFVIKL